MRILLLCIHMPKISHTDQTFHLHNDMISCVIEERNGELLQTYFGPALPEAAALEASSTYKRSYATEHDGFERPFDELPFAFPQFGHGDYRTDAISLLDTQSGQDYFDFHLVNWQIEDHISRVNGMPSVHGGGSELILTLEDSMHLARLELHYIMFSEFAGIVRYNRLSNLCDHDLKIRKFASLSLDLDPAERKILTLTGNHIQEGQIQYTTPSIGRTVFESRKGSSSSTHPPFMAVLEENASWNSGLVYGLELIYSGSHQEDVELDSYRQLRLTAGIHPDLLDWTLNPNESFDTPQAILSCTQGGLNAMALNFHRLFEEHLMPHHDSPILINTWESFYYDTTMTNIAKLTEEAKEAGMELLVLDDGWFRKENNSRSGIGDWTTNLEKLPEGIYGAADLVHEAGMKFGLWFEPEAVSENSQLYSKHPDWILSYSHIKPIEGRHEYLLDLSRADVQDHVINMLDGYLQSGKIDYIKWDMNRPLADLSKSMTSHGYILGLYRILDTITSRYPDLLIEGCSSGGNRLDPGILAYAGQNWLSDNTDPFDRLKIQSGASLFLPPWRLCAHVSASPNHQTGRISSLGDRFRSALFFNPGYELNLRELSLEEKDEIAAQILAIKANRDFLKNARFMQDDNCFARISPDGKRACVLLAQEHFSPANARMHTRLPWFDEHTLYQIKEPETGRKTIMSGALLKYRGVLLPMVQRDFAIRLLEIEAIKKPVQEKDIHDTEI